MFKALTRESDHNGSRKPIRHEKTGGDRITGIGLRPPRRRHGSVSLPDHRGHRRRRPRHVGLAAPLKLGVVGLGAEQEQAEGRNNSEWQRLDKYPSWLI